MSPAISLPAIDPRTVAPEEWWFLADLLPSDAPDARSSTVRLRGVRDKTPYERAAEELVKVTRAWFTRQRKDARRLAAERRKQHRQRNPPPTVNVYRPSFREPWVSLRTALLAFFRRYRDSEDLVAEVLSAKALWRRVEEWNVLPANERAEGLDGLKAYALGIAHKVLADELDEKRKAQPTCIRNLSLAETTGDMAIEDIWDLGVRWNLSLDEDALIKRIDRERGIVRLTADPDRALFWDHLHAWCASRLRHRLGRLWVVTGELTPQELTEVRVDGRRLAPDTATWIRILSMRSCPEDLELFSDTKSSDVVERIYETVKKAFQRGALKNRHTCPPKRSEDGDLLIEGSKYE